MTSKFGANTNQNKKPGDTSNRKAGPEYLKRMTRNDGGSNTVKNSKSRSGSQFTMARKFCPGNSNNA